MVWFVVIRIRARVLKSTKILLFNRPKGLIGSLFLEKITSCN